MNTDQTTLAAFEMVRSNLLKALQASGLSPEEMTKEFFRITLLMAAAACTNHGQMPKSERDELTDEFCNLLRRTVAGVSDPSSQSKH
ncbi:MAG: hypothetical protein ACU836_17490 [Gammaproteobacteria bacterium]